jgi:hypothetical protein
MTNITSIINVIVFDKHQKTIINNTAIVNDIQLAEIIFINECRDHFTKNFDEYTQEEIDEALENGYKENNSKIVFINWPEVKATGPVKDSINFEDAKCVETIETHDGYDHNQEPCKYVVVTRPDGYYTINGHRMFELPIDWDGDVSYDHCLICGRRIQNKTDDLYWWTDGSHLCRENGPFYYTNGGGCMDVLIGKDCQKKYGLK